MPFDTIKDHAQKFKSQAERTAIERKVNANFKQRVKLENLRVNELNRILSLQTNHKLFDDALDQHITDAIDISTDFITNFDRQIKELDQENHDLIQSLVEKKELPIDAFPEEIQEILKEHFDIDVVIVENEDEDTSE